MHRRQGQPGAIGEVGELLVCRPFGEQLQEQDGVADRAEGTGRFVKRVAERRHGCGLLPAPSLAQWLVGGREGLAWSWATGSRRL